VNSIKIGLLTAHLSRRAGGVFEVLIALQQQLQNRPDFDVRLFGVDDHGEIPESLFGSVFGYPSLGPRAFGFANGLKSSVLNFSPQVVHSHGLWMYNSSVSASCRKLGISTLVSPHGMLDPWVFNKGRWKKFPIEIFFENSNLSRASCIHALNSAELKSIRARGIRQPVAVIPNGINLPDFRKGKSPWESVFPGDAKVMLFLGRLHPKKGLDQLIPAFLHLKQMKSCWKLVIAGWGEEYYCQNLKRTVNDLDLDDTIHFAGPVFDAIKHDTLSNADAFVLPSWSEGLPMSVLEAWSYKLPVFMTDECNLSESFEDGAAVKIPHTPMEMAKYMETHASDLKLQDLSNNGFLHVLKYYQWNFLAAQYAELYAWLANEGERPSFVSMN
jgi:poly(glycerol-phosphate) alpha-glucosyltransferase